MSRRALAVAVRQLGAVGPVARLLSPSPHDVDEVTCYDFFRNHITRPLGGTRMYFRSASGKEFWNYTLLQATHAEPAVWHAVAAIGALYMKWGATINYEEVASLSKRQITDGMASTTGGLPYDSDAAMLNANSQSIRLTKQAHMSYNKALHLSKGVKTPLAMLVLSLALVVTSQISGQSVHSSTHIRAGYNIIEELMRESGGVLKTEDEISAAENLTKMTLKWLFFSESKAPYPATDKSFAGHKPLSCLSISALRPTSWNIHLASTLLLEINRRLLVQAVFVPDIPVNPVDNPEILDYPDITTQMNAYKLIVQDLNEWEANVLRLLESMGDEERRSVDVISLKLLHTNAWLLAVSHVVLPTEYTELGWDNCLGLFERVIALSTLLIDHEAKNNLSSLAVTSLDEPSVNMLLWAVATRCRHPLLRRRAVSLLRIAKRLENVWNSTSVAAAAQKIIEVEERDFPISVADWVSACGCTDIDERVWADIEAEHKNPRLWLGGKPLGSTARTAWYMPGEVTVPLRNRVLRVDVLTDYDPRMLKSRADLTIYFADNDRAGHFRTEFVTIYF